MAKSWSQVCTVVVWQINAHFLANIVHNVTHTENTVNDDNSNGVKEVSCAALLQTIVPSNCPTVVEHDLEKYSNLF